MYVHTYVRTYVRTYIRTYVRTYDVILCQSMLPAVIQLRVRVQVRVRVHEHEVTKIYLSVCVNKLWYQGRSKAIEVPRNDITLPDM